jgi:hypothetical protein
VQNEGDIGVPTRGPYEIAYGSLVPKRGQCDNLLVPVCLSSSHIAFGSIRMEPVFMILGQSAATAASLAIDANQPVQDVPYARLRERLLKDGQVLQYTAADTSADAGGKVGLDPATLPGVVVDDAAAKVTGHWQESTAAKAWVGSSYRHDGNAKNGKSSARFEAKLPAAGRYEVRLACVPNTNRATKAHVEVHHAAGTKTLTVNQQSPPPIDGQFLSLGLFDFSADQPAAVLISNHGADGYVIIDAVQWLPAR